MVTIIFLHPTLVNGKLFVESEHTKRCIYISKIDNHENVLSNDVLHRIYFLSKYCDFKVVRRPFLLCLTFIATIHKAQEQTLEKFSLTFAFLFLSVQVYVVLLKPKKLMTFFCTKRMMQCYVL